MLAAEFGGGGSGVDVEVAETEDEDVDTVDTKSVEPLKFGLIH